jgi:hypothetical protein
MAEHKDPFVVSLSNHGSTAPTSFDKLRTNGEWND